MGWFSRFFRRKKTKKYEAPKAKPLQEVKTVGLLIGHTRADKGAVGYDGVAEYDYWSRVAHGVSNLCTKTVAIGTRDVGGVSGGCKEIKRKLGGKPDVLLELHFNAYNKKAKGSEALYIRDYALAKKFCDFMESKGKINRKAKNAVSNGRGASNVKTAQKYSKHSILIEPFFADNKNDHIPSGVMVDYLVEFLNGL